MEDRSNRTPSGKMIRTANRMAGAFFRTLEFYLRYPFYSDYPVYIFHHIPKCGGESFGKVLQKWFFVIGDIYGNRYPGLPSRLKFHHLRSFCCLKGHYHLEGFHLWQVHPGIYSDKKQYRIISFIRDPLQVQISKYYYNVQHGIIDSGRISLEDFLFEEYPANDFYIDGTDTRIIDFALSNRNYLARMLGCTEEDYKTRMEEYYFIGILEHGQESLDILAEMLGKPRIFFPHINANPMPAAQRELPASVLDRFRNANKLDYKLYTYCMKKLGFK